MGEIGLLGLMRCVGEIGPVGVLGVIGENGLTGVAGLDILLGEIWVGVIDPVGLRIGKFVGEIGPD